LPSDTQFDLEDDVISREWEYGGGWCEQLAFFAKGHGVERREKRVMDLWLHDDPWKAKFTKQYIEDQARRVASADGIPAGIVLAATLSTVERHDCSSIRESKAREKAKQVGRATRRVPQRGLAAPLRTRL